MTFKKEGQGFKIYMKKKGKTIRPQKQKHQVRPTIMTNQTDLPSRRCRLNHPLMRDDLLNCTQRSS